MENFQINLVSFNGEYLLLSDSQNVVWAEITNYPKSKQISFHRGDLGFYIYVAGNGLVNNADWSNPDSKK